MPTPLLSVVVPTWNRPEELADCLEGFASQVDTRFEVIVVDDGSDMPLDGVMAPFAGRLDLRLERRPHRGVAAARNVGVVLARAPLLILFDDDQRPLPHLVARCLAFHVAEPDEGAFRLLRVVPDPARPRTACSVAMFEGQAVFAYPQPGQDWGYAGFWGGAVTCKASIFRYGLYDGAYGMAEDAELGLRIAQWLPLACRHDGVADAVQLRTLDVAGIARRWLRMSYFHLLWQRNYPALVSIGTRPAYREAEAIAARPFDLAARVAALDAEAAALGPVDDAAGDPALAARLREFLAGVQAVIRHCQAAGWLAARRDEDLAELLVRFLP